MITKQPSTHVQVDERMFLGQNSPSVAVKLWPLGSGLRQNGARSRQPRLQDTAQPPPPRLPLSLRGFPQDTHRHPHSPHLHSHLSHSNIATGVRDKSHSGMICQENTSRPELVPAGSRQLWRQGGPSRENHRVPEPSTPKPPSAGEAPGYKESGKPNGSH